MKKIFIPYVLIPAAVLGFLTIARAYVEVASPDSAIRPYLSVVVLSLIWTLAVPVMLLRRGVSLGTCLLAGLVFNLLQRLPIGIVYAMAVANEWTVTGTGDPVRYRLGPNKELLDTTPLAEFLGNTLGPVPFGLAIMWIVWSIAWVIAFRGKRPYAGAVATPS